MTVRRSIAKTESQRCGDCAFFRHREDILGVVSADDTATHFWRHGWSRFEFDTERRMPIAARSDWDPTD